MDEVPDARDLSRATVERLVDAVEPAWSLRDATPVERGFCTVYRLVVGTDAGERAVYLKASPDGNPWGIPTEARLQAVLHEHTSVPVPDVLGVVDDDPALPTPSYLMSALPGEELAYERVARLSDGTLRRLARDTGRYLAELHDVSAVDSFGHVRHDGTELEGGRPSGDPATLTVGEPRETWPAYLCDRVDQALDRHADSRFAHLTEALAGGFDEGIAALSGPFEPVLGRNDHGLHNLLVGPDTGRVEAMLDWGYTLAVPAAFDVEFAVYIYSGAFLSGLPDVADRRPLVREAILAGYREVAPDRADALATREPLSQLLAVVRLMNDFHHLTLPEGTTQAVADAIEADARALLDDAG